MSEELAKMFEEAKRLLREKDLVIEKLKTDLPNLVVDEAIRLAQKVQKETVTEFMGDVLQDIINDISKEGSKIQDTSLIGMALAYRHTIDALIVRKYLDAIRRM